MNKPKETVNILCVSSQFAHVFIYVGIFALYNFRLSFF